MDFKIDIQFIGGDRSLCNDWWTMEAGAIDLCFKLYYIKSGKGWMLFGDELCELKPGRLYFVNGYKLSRQWVEKEMDIYWVHFVAGGLNPSVVSSPLPAYYSWSESEIKADEFEAGVDGIYCRELDGLAAVGADCRVRSITNNILANLLDGCCEGEYREWSAAFERIKPAIDYMDTHFIVNPQLETIAAMANLTPNYFHRAFKKILGSTPHEYMLKKRLSKAKYLLTTSSLPISEIAELTGYENSYYFSRTFKKNTGKTPSQVRKNSPV